LKPAIKKLYYSISEVSEITDLKAYVLRYWETEFTNLNPPKNRAGNRTYRQKDIEVILKIKDLLYKKRFTIDGARNFLKNKKSVDLNENSSVLFTEKEQIILSKIKEELNSILSIISK
tara:strand:+ start:183 stop:536 length:354 start_codon:yes stop_codon:yes gene_type:complete